jgi:uncharacterized protein (TIGR03083 family)
MPNGIGPRARATVCPTDSSEVFALVAAERRRAAGMFEGLREEQWAAQSLCTEWTVRDIAAHLIGPFRISVPRFLAGAVLSGGFHTYSVKATRRLAQRPASEIVAILRANAERTFVAPRYRSGGTPDRPGRAHPRRGPAPGPGHHGVAWRLAGGP